MKPHLPLNLTTLHLLLLAAVSSEPVPPVDLAPILAPLLESSKLPSLAAAVVGGDEIRGIGAVGVRKLGDPTPVTISDKYHLGSCTKSMTATLTAAMIDDGILTWETTIGEVLTEKVPQIHPDFAAVTVEQLLVHVGGFASQPPGRIWSQAFADQGQLSPREQRLAFVMRLLESMPSYPPGTQSVYSNQGYATVGVILETLAGKPWETLLRERIFEPLEMTSAGFRAPSAVGQVDQPWGHSGREPIPQGPQADNPDAIGPAGTVHASIGDWAKFARFHLRKEPGLILKTPESFAKLQETLPKSGNHAVGGWLIHDMKFLGGTSFQATGSNTLWFALLWILPGKDQAIVVATNSAQPNAFSTCDQLVAKLLDFDQP